MSDEYVRDFRELACKVQDKVAKATSECWQGTRPDFFGEDRMIESLEEMLAEAGWDTGTCEGFEGLLQRPETTYLRLHQRLARRELP